MAFGRQGLHTRLCSATATFPRLQELHKFPWDPVRLTDIVYCDGRDLVRKKGHEGWTFITRVIDRYQSSSATQQ